MAGLKNRATVSAAKRKEVLNRVLSKSTPSYKQYVNDVAVPLPTGGSGTPTGAYGGGGRIPPAPLPPTPLGGGSNPWGTLDGKIHRVPPPPGSPPSPWYGEIYDNILGGIQDSFNGEGSPIQNYLETLNASRWQNPATVEPHRYYEDDQILVQNNENGNYAMIPTETWLQNRGTLAPTYTVVEGAGIGEFDMDSTPYLGDQPSMVEFGLYPPTTGTEGAYSPLPTEGSNLPIDPWNMVPGATRDRDRIHVLPLPPEGEIARTTPPVIRMPKLSQSRKKKSTKEQRELARYLGLIK